MTDTAQTGTGITRNVDGVELPTPGTYTLDPTHTRIGFVARHLMVTKVRGHFAQFEGSITIAAEPKGSTADVTIQTISVETGTTDRDNHLRSGDFFEAEKYPEMTFRNARVVSQKGTDFTVVGDLTIKGITHDVQLAVELDGVVKDPYGNTRLAVTATTEIDREAWGLTWNAALETGGVMVSKKIAIEIESEAVLQA
jgi:polyisoprenoid-binding protein YceI